VAAQYNADAASMGQPVTTQWVSSHKQHTADHSAVTSSIPLKLQHRRQMYTQKKKTEKNQEHFS